LKRLRNIKRGGGSGDHPHQEGSPSPLNLNSTRKKEETHKRSPRKGFRMKAVKSYRLECVEHGINVTSHMNLPTRWRRRSVKPNGNGDGNGNANKRTRVHIYTARKTYQLKSYIRFGLKQFP